MESRITQQDQLTAGEAAERAGTAMCDALAKELLNQSGKPRFTPRQFRLANALAAGRWVSREDVDRIVGASNGPDVVLQLRRRVTGDDGIEMRMVGDFDRDGQAIKFGQYRMTHEGMRRAVLAGLLTVGATCDADRQQQRKAARTILRGQGDLF